MKGGGATDVILSGAILSEAKERGVEGPGSAENGATGGLAMSRMLWVYILTNRSGGLYVGVTNDLRRRCFEHALGNSAAFTARYRMNRLVHVEAYSDPRDAVRREKQLEGWTRRKKIALIERTNREWRDLLDC